MARKTMTPSAESRAMTDGQIAKAVSNYRALLEKHAGEFDSRTAQIVLGQPELANEMLSVFRRRAEAISEMIVRRVTVVRNRNPQEAISATNRTEYLNNEVVDDMPRCEGEEVEVYFFPLKKYTSVADVQRMMEECGLKPDPYAVDAVNEQDPIFADKHPNFTQWVDKNGNHCYLAFSRWDGKRDVDCSRSESGWDGDWFVCGVRK